MSAQGEHSQPGHAIVRCSSSAMVSPLYSVSGADPPCASSQWVQAKAQEAFRKNKYQEAENRIQKNLSDARKALRLLERANQMDFKAVMRLLRLSYGILGQERRDLLQPFVDSTRLSTFSPDRFSDVILNAGSKTSQNVSSTGELPTQVHISKDHLASVLAQTTTIPKPLHFGYQRSTPPILSAPLAALIKDATAKNVEPALPQPLYKPLHGKREANLRWRFLIRQLGKVTPPLPGEIRQEVEWKSRVGLDDSRKEGISYPANWGEWEQQILQTIKAWNNRGTESKEQRWENEKFHPSVGGKPPRPNTLTPRLYRRIWQHLLDDVPILDVQLVALTSDAVNGRGTGDKTTLSTPSLIPFKATFSVSKSAQSYKERQGKSLKQQARINGFDRIGMSGDTSLPGTKTRSKGPNRDS
ncbi:hypothetical protein B0O80DRAFT_189878 [Mortierella sp. GBAus27b]|nr:hypothetical protein B0O80DRAFT_189878 [Mortierella sp. GBAus27b]